MLNLPYFSAFADPAIYSKKERLMVSLKSSFQAGCSLGTGMDGGKHVGDVRAYLHLSWPNPSVSSPLGVHVEEHLILLTLGRKEDVILASFVVVL